MVLDPGRAHGRPPLIPASTDEPFVVTLLGRIALRRDAGLVVLPGTRARLLLVALALRPGRSRSAAVLIEEVWGGDPPRSPMNALHTQVSRLRAALPDGVLAAGPAGYRIALRPEQVDLTAAQQSARRAGAALTAGDAAEALAVVARARGLWCGEPGTDLPPSGPAVELAAAAAECAGALDDIERAARAATGDLDGAAEIAREQARQRPADEARARTLMQLLATAGRTNEALDVFVALRTTLATELGTDPGAAITELNTAILQGRFTSRAQPELPGPVAPPPPAIAAVGVRAEPNELLGRADDLTELARLLRVSRVTTVLGPGGAGKTRVANELAVRASATQPVVLVELASVRPEGTGRAAAVDIETAIAGAVGLGETVRDRALPQVRPPTDSGRKLRDALSARPMLLVLDNCEHLIEGAAVVVADLVGRCPQLTVLTTSRSPLAITAETVFPLAPLAIDPAGSPATDLFAARARAVRPSVRLDAAVVARLCHTLDGLPLAIELAAARVRTMSVEDIERRLDQRFALLRSGDRASPERHRTLHAVIAWSWNLLEPAEQIALRRMCRFPAGFTLDAAELVAGGPEVGDIATAVDGLVGQSLLTVVEDEGVETDPGLGVRYRMLETVREFGEQQLVAADSGTGAEIELVESRMARWACEFAVALAQRYLAGDEIGPALLMVPELDNLVAVLRRAEAVGDRHTVYGVFPAVSMRWVAQGAHLELMGWIPRLLALPPPDRASGTHADLYMLCHAMTALHLAFMSRGIRELAVVRFRARALLRHGTGMDGALRFLGQLLTYPADTTRIARLLANGSRSDDPQIRVVALVARANIWENMGRIFASRRDARAARLLTTETEVWSRAMVVQHLGALEGQTAHYRESVGYYEEAAELLYRIRAYDESLEMRSFMAVSLAGSGEPEWARRELAAALGLSDSGGAGLELIDDPTIRRNHRLSTIAAGLAEIELAEGDIDAGLAHFRRAVDLLGWPGDEFTPGPGALLVCSTTVAAHVLAGRIEAVAALIPELAVTALERLGVVPDLPQIGAVACALGSALLALDEHSGVGVELLALATVATGRQDYPVMRWERHHELWRERLGGLRLDEAVDRARRLRRKAAGARILELIGTVGAETGAPGPLARPVTD
ncbi:BTAD domain-containing putative transcriptional regulator [Nocardia sp. NBC_01329]|uniref:BTAD domain-containing putative transcriptional regulator n=1 Tax=Nocardia sp. NBC_01329 TaxID=2903594 RepID=UPI002E0DC295|nr:winged helix-turn-helix domain-containing protein [Nocardia sp. NBC_01329]